jgi:hypothetical protein
VNRILSTCVSVLVVWQGVLQAVEFNASDLGNNWFQHEKFGIFFDAHQTGWHYHLDHGWIYVDKWNDKGSWIYKPLEDSNESAFTTQKKVALGWMWSNAQHYPQLYNDELKEWLYFDKDRNKSKFYHHERKKYLAEDFILKTSVESEDWKILAPFFEDLSDYNESEHELIPGLDTFYADKWSVSIPKADLADDSNWSALIYSLLENPSEADKRGIEKILETEDSILVNWGVGEALTIKMEPMVYYDFNKSLIQQTKVERMERMADINITTVTGIVAVEKYEVKTSGHQFQITNDNIAASGPEDIERIATVQAKESQVNIDPSIKTAIDDAGSLADQVKQEKLNQNLINEDAIEIIIDLEEDQSTSVEDLEAKGWEEEAEADAFAEGEIKLISESNYELEELENFEPAKLTADQESNWDEQYEEWILNPESYGGLSVVQTIKEAKDNQATKLAISSYYVSDITPLTGLTNLTELVLESNNVGDILPLAGLTNLTKLNLHQNNISDLTPLAGLTNLTTLFLGRNNISDLTPLSGLTNLEELLLLNNNITDITPLAGLTNLEELNLSNTNITDLTPLAGLTKLTWLTLNENNISASQKSMLEEALPNTNISW